MKDKEKLKKICKKAGFICALGGAVMVALRICGIRIATDTVDAFITAVSGLLVAAGIIGGVKTNGGDKDEEPPEQGDGILP
ncbi:MAG: hypothetical protein LBC13_01855 [Clostridiales bacterium]|nr:hypothetical protein [Clostridiales bacterium]